MFGAAPRRRVLLHEWRRPYTEAFPHGTYSEPGYPGHDVTTHWDNDTTGGHRLRSYLIYLAMAVKPTGWTPGMVSFGTSPENWSAKSMLMQIAQQRIGFDDVAMTFNVKTTPALGWDSAHNVNHSVAVMGFSTSTDKYYIVDTCGSACSYGANPNGGGRWVPAADIWSGPIGVVS